MTYRSSSGEMKMSLREITWPMCEYHKRMRIACEQTRAVNNAHFRVAGA